jgi:hypothetical protein
MAQKGLFSNDDNDNDNDNDGAQTRGFWIDKSGLR